MTEDRAADALLEHIGQWAMEPEVTPGFTRHSALFSTMRAYENVERILAERLPALLAAERERAWNEGWGAAYTMARNWGHVDGWEDEWPDNPYRTEPAPGEGASRG